MQTNSRGQLLRSPKAFLWIALALTWATTLLAGVYLIERGAEHKYYNGVYNAPPAAAALAGAVLLIAALVVCVYMVRVAVCGAREIGATEQSEGREGS